MQNLPPGQQNYGYSNPYGAQPAPTVASSLEAGARAKSSLGDLDGNVAGALAYIMIVGIILLVVEKENRFVRFNAMQSILYGVSTTVLFIVLMVISLILTFILALVTGAAGAAGGDAGGGLAAIFGILISLLWGLVWAILPLLMMGGLILAAVKAYQGKVFKLPIIGKFAEKFVNK